MIHLNRKARVFLPTILMFLIVAGCQKTDTTNTAGYGYVIESTQTDTVESSGSIEPYQMTTLTWKTSGGVLTVDVVPNQAVVKGTTLATLDPSTAPTSVNQAISDLITARQELDDAKNSKTALAQAEVALAAAKDAYYLELGYYNTLGKQIGNENYINILIAALFKAEQAVEDAETNFNRFGEASDNDVNKAAALAKLSQARIDLKSAEINLKYYQSVPNTMDTATITAEFNLAKAQLDDTQRAYDKLKDGSNTDAVTSAQAKVDAAQATVNNLSIIAPFDGDVVVIYPRIGDLVSSNTEAAIVVNRSSLFVEVYIDETTISNVAVGNPVVITFDAIPELSIPGKVEFINTVGVVSSGVVNFTVRVELDSTDPRILIGQTANITIQTGEPNTVLYVPVTSVQSDAQGEYVIRIKSDGTQERVSVVSGTIIDDLVIVAGDLAADNQVLLYNSSYSSSTEDSGLIPGRGVFMIGTGSEGGQGAPGGTQP